MIRMQEIGNHSPFFVEIGDKPALFLLSGSRDGKIQYGFSIPTEDQKILHTGNVVFSLVAVYCVTCL